MSYTSNNIIIFLGFCASITFARINKFNQTKTLPEKIIIFLFMWLIIWSWFKTNFKPFSMQNYSKHLEWCRITIEWDIDFSIDEICSAGSGQADDELTIFCVKASSCILLVRLFPVHFFYLTFIDLLTRCLATYCAASRVFRIKKTGITTANSSRLALPLTT